MSNLLVELRLAVRQLVTRPGFSALVIATLGLSIGAATAVFSLFDAILLRPFPFADPDRLVRVRTYRAGSAEADGDVSVYDFQDWQRAARSFSSSAAWFSFPNNLTGMGPARAVRMTFATADLFSTLGVQPLRGRTFTAAEDVAGGSVRQAVLSHALWQDVFAGADAALGRTIHLRGESYTVIGIMPAGFDYPDRTEIWVPLMARYATYPEPWWQQRDVRIHRVVARVRPGSSPDEAQHELDAIVAAQAAAYPDTNRDIRARVLSLRDAEVGVLKPYVQLVAAAVALLLLVGWTNVAGLFIARTAARGRELAIRTALGARTWHVLRQLLAESAIYAALGGLAGVAVGYAAVGVLKRLVPVALPAWMQFGVDGRVLTFCLAVTVTGAVAFGLAPLAQRGRRDLHAVLKQAGKGTSGTGAPRQVRRLLLIAEVAMSVALLVGAGLMLRSFARLMAVDTGVRTDGVLVAYAGRYLPNVTPEQALVGYADEFRRMREALLARPGIRAVSGGSDLPYIDQPEERPHYDIATRRRAAKEQRYRAPIQGADVLPGYFDQLGIRLLEGRDFTDADTLGRQPVVILSRHAADVLFPGESALGQEIRWGNDPVSDPWTTVIGIVSNTRWNPAERTPGLEMYWSFRQFPGPTLHFLIRTAGDPAQFVPDVRRTLQTVNPEFSVRSVQPLTTIARDAVWQRRLWGFLLGAFAALAVLLMAIGLYGVMSYLVTLQTREIGIRMALGAARGTVVRAVLGHGLGLALVGVALGLVVAGVTSRFLRTVLFEISAFDLVTFVSAPLLLLGVAAVACALPAWRASRVDPLVALRDE